MLEAKEEKHGPSQPGLLTLRDAQAPSVPGVTGGQCHDFCVVFLIIIRKLRGRWSYSHPSLPAGNIGLWDIRMMLG